MDPVTQIALGASVAGVCVPAGHRRRAMLLGAALGTVPDLDILIDFGGPVANYTCHRGFSHSLLVLAPFSVVLWLALRRWWSPVRAAPGPWLAAIVLALLTHPLLDAHTAYGTQLWWPLAFPPVAWSTIFIIDPLYTLPLLAGGIVAMVRPSARRAQAWIVVGLLVSSSYLGWTWVGKTLVEANARAVLRRSGRDGAPLFSCPAPFSTFLWRIVVLTEDGYLVGLDSLAVDDGPTEFVSYASDTESLAAATPVWAVERLRWFAQDFLRATVEDDTLIVSDLRMGQEPYYAFTHAVAGRAGPHWHAIETRRLPVAVRGSVFRTVWRRMWHGR